MFVDHPIGGLVREAPAKAKAMIAKAIREAKGSTAAAARALAATSGADVQQRTLNRWITTLGLRALVASLQAKHPIGRPQGSTIASGRAKPRKTAKSSNPSKKVGQRNARG